MPDPDVAATLAAHQPDERWYCLGPHPFNGGPGVVAWPCEVVTFHRAKVEAAAQDQPTR